MNGTWIRPDDAETQEEVANRLKREGHLARILMLLEQSKAGLSNAQLDASLSNYSQWMTLWHIRELEAMGLVEYRTELFGEPGKYLVTDLGLSLLNKIRT